jgi:methyl-accepting chemotaxis protein
VNRFPAERRVAGEPTDVSPTFRILIAFGLGAAATLLGLALALVSGVLEPGAGTAGTMAAVLTLAAAALAAAGGAAWRIARSATGELERLSATLARQSTEGRALASEARLLARSIVELTAGAGGSLAAVESGTALQASTAARTFDAIGQQREDLAGASRLMAGLADRVVANAVSISRMDQTISRAAELVGGLTASIDQASAATREGDADARKLARELAGLAEGIGQARQALGEMRSDAEAVHGDSSEVARTMARLEQEAGRIGEAIESVVVGSSAARASNDRILSVTNRLASRLGGIDDIIGVIRGLAERTKLLSINASIIASEAGEHGRAFAVVASEVKDLATSTAGAIAEISTALGALQSGFNETVDSIQQGQAEVERGVSQARNAVELLRSIPSQVHDAAGRIHDIAARTEQQVIQSEAITATVLRTWKALSQVDEMLAGQALRNGRMLEFFTAIVETGDQVLASAREHASASREVNQVVSEISGDFRRLSERVRESASAMGKVVDLSEDVLRGTDLNRRRVEELSRVIGEIRDRASTAGRFRPDPARAADDTPRP